MNLKINTYRNKETYTDFKISMGLLKLKRINLNLQSTQMFSDNTCTFLEKQFPLY